jgi:hypothetical protein
VHKLPKDYHQELVVKQLVGRVAGKVEIVMMKPVGSFRGHFVRVCVIHDVRLPLTCFGLTSRARKYLYAIKY